MEEQFARMDELEVQTARQAAQYRALQKEAQSMYNPWPRTIMYTNGGRTDKSPVARRRSTKESTRI